MTRDSFAGATIILMIMNMAARLIGFVRETVIAAIYGATGFTDAYQVAYTLPYFLQMVLGMALVSSIVPVIVKKSGQGKIEEGNLIASSTINITTLIMMAFAIVCIFGAKLLVKITAPNLSAEVADMATLMTKIMFPSVVFMSVAQLITGILNANQKFGVAAFAPAFGSLVIMLGTLFFGKTYEYALPVATLVSFIGMLIIQLPALFKTGFKYSFTLDLKDEEVKKIFGNLFPVFLGTATYQLYLAINRYFASGLAEGSISALNYASKLMNLPLALFVSSLVSAIFPLLSRQALEDNVKPMWQSLLKALKLSLLTILPCALGLMALATPIIKILFERGAFDANATALTANALIFFGPGMAGMALAQILTRAYYAKGNVKMPMYSGLISIAFNIVFSIILMKPMGIAGLALANSIAAITNALIMFIVLKNNLSMSISDCKPVISSGIKALIASVATAVAANFSYNILINHVSQLISLGCGICFGVLIYIAVISILKEYELFRFIKDIFHK